MQASTVTRIGRGLPALMLLVGSLLLSSPSISHAEPTSDPSKVDKCMPVGDGVCEGGGSDGGGGGGGGGEAGGQGPVWSPPNPVYVFPQPNLGPYRPDTPGEPEPPQLPELPPQNPYIVQLDPCQVQACIQGPEAQPGGDYTGSEGGDHEGPHPTHDPHETEGERWGDPGGQMYRGGSGPDLECCEVVP